jgi:hypothetical protein
MTRKQARKIAEHITNIQLEEMLNVARIKVKDWTKVSSVNKGMTKGTAWNILGKDFLIKNSYHILAKTHMVLEFGEFLPADLLEPKKEKIRTGPVPVHQEPESLGFVIRRFVKEKLEAK